MVKGNKAGTFVFAMVYHRLKSKLFMLLLSLSSVDFLQNKLFQNNPKEHYQIECPNCLQRLYHDDKSTISKERVKGVVGETERLGSFHNLNCCRRYHLLFHYYHAILSSAAA